MTAEFDTQQSSRMYEPTSITTRHPLLNHPFLCGVCAHRPRCSARNSNAAPRPRSGSEFEENKRLWR